MLDFLSDKKTLTAIAGAIVAAIVQIAAKHGIVLDPQSANTLTGACVVIFGVLLGAHAHVENATVHADAHLAATQASLQAFPDTTTSLASGSQGPTLTGGASS